MRHTEMEYKLDKETYGMVSYFALQYPKLKAKRNDMRLTLRGLGYDGSGVGSSTPGDPVGEAVARLEPIQAKIDLIEDTAAEAAATYDPWLYPWLLKGVTEGVGYETLRRQGMLIGHGIYYKIRQRFFYLLAQELDDRIR